MYREKKVSVVVPALNEERFIANVIESMPSFVDRIYVVDDNSTDATGQIVEGYVQQEGSRTTLMTHQSRLGVGASIVAGYRRSLSEDMDIVAVMAGDGQMDPAQLPRLLDPIAEGKADYSKGNRLLSSRLKEMPKGRIRGNALLTFMTKISSGYYDVMDPQNGYTAVSKEALTTINLDRIYTGYGYCNDILIQLNRNNLTVADVVMPPRYRDEKSYIKVGRYTARLSWLLFKGFFHRIFAKYKKPRVHPILLFYLSSFILIPAGIILGLIVSWDRIFNGYYAIGTVLLTALLLILGTQSLCFATFFDAMKSGYHMRTDHARNEIVSRGFFRRLRRQYLGINFHPLGLFYMVAFVLFAIGIILGIMILYGRVVTGGFSLGTVTLDLMVLVVGTQFLFFAMLFEAERERFME
ncbi:MAG: glycosyltransferase family 2 protein [Methanobacteriota archaeon]|nr:MAG: glycosyltransferase family 2 protein [Euryarchaeota archaeon]